MPGLKVFTGSLWRAVGVEDSYWDVLTAVSGGATVGLSWPIAGNSPSSYEVMTDSSITNVGLVNSYTVSGLTVGQTYSFKVRPVYSDGSTGGWSFSKNAGPTGFNAATGGVETTISNYNGTGQTWKVHTFNSNGSINVTSAVSPFSVLVLGGGDNGGSNRLDCCTVGNRGGGNGGNGGKYILSTSQTLLEQNISVTVGGAGGNSLLGSLNSSSGSTGGTGGTGAGGGGGNGGNGSVGLTSTITGSSVQYSGGGGGGAHGTGCCGGFGGGTGAAGGGNGAGASTDCCAVGGSGNGSAASANRGSGGGGGSVSSQQYNSASRSGGAGGSGVVVVAYRIA